MNGRAQYPIQRGRLLFLLLSLASLLAQQALNWPEPAPLRCARVCPTWHQQMHLCSRHLLLDSVLSIGDKGMNKMDTVQPTGSQPRWGTQAVSK